MEGLQGVYIATLVSGSMKEENMRSVITFDKGGTWEFLQPPAVTGYGEKIDCEVRCIHLSWLFTTKRYLSFYAYSSQSPKVRGSLRCRHGHRAPRTGELEEALVLDSELLAP